MKINRRRIKQLRKQRLWSQEEVATASGLSLRTIQRLEADGQGSASTLKSLASVFELEHEELLESTDSDSDYYNLQLGTVLIGFFVGVCLISTWALIADRMEMPVFSSINIVNTIFCTLFSTLTTKVDRSTVQWHFTFRFWRKKIAIEDITKVSTVRNKAWWGLGIRFIPEGMLYCVSGLDAVELKLASGKTIRIGSDEPMEFKAAIDNAIENLRLDQ